MVQPLATPNAAIAPPRGGMQSAAIWGAGGLGVLLLVAAVALWFRYGSAVFFETIAAGFANCF
jgi:hypothetical protein